MVHGQHMMAIFVRMSLEDFSREFQTLEICYLGPDSVCDIDHLYQKAWQGTLIEGSWKRKVNAGGCRNFPGEFREVQMHSAIISLLKFFLNTVPSIISHFHIKEFSISFFYFMIYR